jgi:MFS family permease
MYSVIGFLPEFLQTPKSTGYGFGASIIQSGLYLLPLTVTMFITGMLSGRIAAAIGSKAAVIIGAFFSLAGYLMLAFAHTHPWEIYTASALLGVGIGLAFSAMSNLVVQAVPAEQTGVASGMNANIRTIGGAIGAAVMSSIVTSVLIHGGSPAGLFPAESGYTRGFAFLAAMTVVAIVAAIFIPTTPKVPAGEDRDHHHHLEHAELALIPAGTIAE